ncbi:glycosyltransferase [Calothrix sp. NIES-3974]|uniref:glycosyltransferase n=1 Tax=Calothrix sp. NIES-3974 TaxID=2005462 RepID=UPI000B602BFC|nr:glycosyltransferase [Calothrix sp. NIES-3974]BAZ03616.1 glycosyltransferase [Calothrix sp. NIES-3974]
MKNHTFHLWFPNIFGFKGGIQVYSAFFLQAIQNIDPQSQYDIFLKHDVNTSSEIPYLPHTRFHFSGAISSKLRTSSFAYKIISQGFLQQPDLIISTHLNFALAAYWLKRFRNIPYWIVAHGIEAWDIKNTGLKNALYHADLILAVSSYTRKRLILEQQLDPNKVVIIPNTFDIHRFIPQEKPEYLLEKYKLTKEQPVILTVSRLVEVKRFKGYDQILKAIPLIRQVIPDIHYLIVGKGNDSKRIEESILKMQLQDYVTLVGFVADEQLCDYYNLCDLFAMPGKREGFGIVYLEALACGKPVLAGNQDGSVDALCHGELGALINPDDIDEIAQTIIQILKRNYPNPLMYEPEMLRQKVIDSFGFTSFQKTLANYLESHFRSHLKLDTKSS